MLLKRNPSFLYSLQEMRSPLSRVNKTFQPLQALLSMYLRFIAIIHRMWYIYKITYRSFTSQVHNLLIYNTFSGWQIMMTFGIFLICRGQYKGAYYTEYSLFYFNWFQLIKWSHYSANFNLRDVFLRGTSEAVIQFTPLPQPKLVYTYLRADELA